MGRGDIKYPDRKKKPASPKWERCKAFFGYRCAYCGQSDKLTKDHIIPRYYGGTDMAFNIIPCCQRCNSSKGKKNAASWYRKQPFYSPFREQVIQYYLFQLYLNRVI